MRPAARVSAAIEIVGQFDAGGPPLGKLLAAWARTNRYAGSKDRRAITDLVFDVLRKKASYAAYMQSDGPRALVLAALADAWGLSLIEIEALFDGGQHHPAPLKDAEREGLIRTVSADAADGDPWRLADVPEWLFPSLERAFGEQAIEEGRGLASRAPIDLRANRLKTSRDELLAALDDWKPAPLAPPRDGLRILQPGKGRRVPALEASEPFSNGAFELQDKGSQLAVRLTGAQPGMQVLDLCAGAGGKTLALAALMDNTGQIHAYDIDDKRMKPLAERALRAGVRNLQVLKGGDRSALAALDGRMDLVLVDAPCTGSGTWRRKPDSKWRLTPEQLDARIEEQDTVLADGAKAVKPGGRLVYVTCSWLPRENEERVAAFLAARPDFSLLAYEEAWRQCLEAAPAETAIGNPSLLQLTPARHGCDGFFVAVLQKTSD